MGNIKQYYVIVDEVHYGPFSITEIKAQGNLKPTTKLLDIDAQHTVCAKDIDALKDVFSEVFITEEEVLVMEQSSKSKNNTPAIWKSLVVIVFCLGLLLWFVYRGEKENSSVSIVEEVAFIPAPIVKEESVLWQMKEDAEQIQANRAKIVLLEKKVQLINAELNAAYLERKDIETFHLFRTTSKRNAQLEVVDAKIEALQQEKTNFQLEINQLQSLI